MFLVALFLYLLGPFLWVLSAEEAEHRDFQYNSKVDAKTGMYNFAYDTGHDNEIAHSLHMQYRDMNGIVRGRYGYTDPRGKLRVVEYEAGPDGFKARGDVGPDQFPHDQKPDLTPEKPQSALAAYSLTPRFDLQLIPSPVQMAGWDPGQDPMGNVRSSNGAENSFVGGIPGDGVPYLYGQGYDDETQNTTTGAPGMNYNVETEYYVEPYTGTLFSSNEGDINAGTTTSGAQLGAEEQYARIQAESPVNIFNIGVNPNDIRATASPVHRSVDDTKATVVRRSSYKQEETGYLPARVATPYRYYPRQTHDHDAEKYRQRYTHDHDAEKYRQRYTHDHDAEKYRQRYTHDHDAEKYRSRYTHDHDAEKYRQPQTHDHDAEIRYRQRQRDDYYSRYPYRNRYYTPRKIYYRDSHSMVPHEHYNSPVYQNHRDHQHSDVHLYGRSQSYSSYPATAKPRQLKYIPADKYHDKYYYWTYD